jgi:hypothetical protein
MNIAQKKNVIGILTIVALILGGLSIANLRVDLPEEYIGQHSIKGKIQNCEIKDLGKSSYKFFVGVSLESSDKVYRINPEKKEKSKYEFICTSKQSVTINYHAVKRLIGPVRLWVDSINAI